MGEIEDELNIIKLNMTDLANAILEKDLKGFLDEGTIKKIKAVME